MNLGDLKAQSRRFAQIAHESTRGRTGLRQLGGGFFSMASNVQGVGGVGVVFIPAWGIQPEVDFGGGRNPGWAGVAAFWRVTEWAGGACWCTSKGGRGQQILEKRLESRVERV